MRIAKYTSVSFIYNRAPGILPTLFVSSNTLYFHLVFHLWNCCGRFKNNTDTVSVGLDSIHHVVRSCNWSL